MNNNTASNKARLHGLEVIRGLAALSVVVFHLEALYVQVPDGPVQALVRSFSGAVPVFFALSAFSLLIGYRDTLFDEPSLARFYTRRVFRILPLFYAMLVAYLALAAWNGVGISWAEILGNLFFLFPFLPGKHESIVWAGWSLGVESAFYVMFPIFALIAKSLRASLMLLGALVATSISMPIMVSIIGLNRSYSAMSVPSNLLYFQAGVVTYAFVRYLSRTNRMDSVRAQWTPRGSVVLLISALFLAALSFLSVPSFLTLTAACCLWIFCAYCGLPAWLDNKAFRLVGRLSYGVYLIHPLVMYGMRQLGIYARIDQHIDNPHLLLLACSLVTLPAVAILAYGSYRIIESPGITLGETLLARRWSVRGVARSS